MEGKFLQHIKGRITASKIIQKDPGSLFLDLVEDIADILLECRIRSLGDLKTDQSGREFRIIQERFMETGTTSSPFSYMPRI